MNRIKIMAVIFLLPIIALVGLGVDFGWKTTKDVVVIQDTLHLKNPTNGRDSTAAFPWCKALMISMRGGASADSFVKGAAANCDSFIVRAYLRGWTDKQRTQLLFQTPLWSYAAPFKMKKGPGKNVWVDKSDSTTRLVYSDRSFFPAYTAGTGTWDSTRVDLVDLKNQHLAQSEFAPYYDVIVLDSTAAKGWTGVVTITGVNR